MKTSAAKKRVCAGPETINTLNVFGDTSAHCEALAARDKTLARALAAIDEPYIRRRPGGFEGLFRIIVEQQVSVPSAQAIWKRCCENVRPLTAEAALAMGEEGLRECGLTRQKSRYVYGVAAAHAEGALDFSALAALDDEAASKTLQSLKGVGPWTAAIYLLFCEGRVDIWPPGDVALLGAYAHAKTYGPKPAMKNLDVRAQKWAPFRGLAAHILWTYYAHIRGRTPI